MRRLSAIAALRQFEPRQRSLFDPGHTHDSNRPGTFLLRMDAKSHPEGTFRRRPAYRPNVTRSGVTTPQIRFDALCGPREGSMSLSDYDTAFALLTPA